MRTEAKLRCVLFVVLAVILAPGVAEATEAEWTIIIKAGSGGTFDAVEGSGAEVWAASRTSATTVDDPSVQDPGEFSPPPPTMPPVANVSWYRPSRYNGTPALPWACQRDVRRPLMPGNMIKEYGDLIVWAFDGYTAPEITLFIHGAGVPNVVAGQAVAYKFLMTYAPQGYAGQTEWILPAAPAGTAKSPWFTITLPSAGAVAGNPVQGDGPFAAVQTAGYRFTLVTPEPGSLLALGAGLSGFLGLAARRRK